MKNVDSQVCYRVREKVFHQVRHQVSYLGVRRRVTRQARVPVYNQTRERTSLQVVYQARLEL